MAPFRQHHIDLSFPYLARAIHEKVGLKPPRTIGRFFIGGALA
jgi:hypothetical protein